MKASYVLPSGNYNILLEKDDVIRLLETGHINVRTLRDIPCTSSRMAYDSEKNIMYPVEKRIVDNFLSFHIYDSLADIEPGEHHVQFLTLNIDDDVLKEIKKGERK